MNQNQSGEISKAMALQRQRFDSKETESGEPLAHPVGISTTESVFILKIEAELLDEGKELHNPHIPLNQETLENAKQEIEANGLEPAWLQ